MPVPLNELLKLVGMKEGVVVGRMSFLSHREGGGGGFVFLSHIVICFYLLCSDLELKPVGILEVKLVQAKGLTNKDIVGKSDPYAKLYIRPLRDRIKTSKIIVYYSSICFTSLILSFWIWVLIGSCAFSFFFSFFPFRTMI